MVPNVADIVNRNLHLIRDTPLLNKLFPPGTITVANKRGNNLKELMLRGDPYNIKTDLTDNDAHGYVKCGKKCDSCDNFVQETSYVTCNATGRKFYLRRDSTCSTPNIIYLAFCKRCGKQGVGSTVKWKPRLANYKCHIKKNVSSCTIVKHFIDECSDSDVPFKHLGFVILDVVNNTNGLNQDKIDELLLVKEKFWIGTLVTQHKGLNGSHDWNRTKRTEKPTK